MGPGYDFEGRMAFDVVDRGDGTYLFLVREARAVTPDDQARGDEARRRENAVVLRSEQLQALISIWGKRLRLW